MRYRLLFVFFILIMILTGCGVKHLVVGDFYLTSSKYKNGIEFFLKELRKYPNDPKVHYYLGRYYLADNQPRNGLKHLKKAVRYEPSKSDYQFWLGVAYSENNQAKMEWKSYEKALSLNPKHLKSRIYLAHTQMERKKYKAAISNYSFVLKEWPDEPASLYNRALALKYLKRTKEEEVAWKEYLDFYPSGPLTRTAVEHLNSLGNFSYRNHVIGLRTITLRKVRFRSLSAKLNTEAEETLGFLGDVLSTAKHISMHVIVYQKNNKKLAEQRAKSIKKYLIARYPQIASSRVKVSWFGVSETIRIGRKSFRVEESVNFVTAL